MVNINKMRSSQPWEKISFLTVGEKILFWRFFDIWFHRCCYFRQFFPKKKNLYLAFAVANFGHHATYHLKGLDKGHNTLVGHSTFW